MSKPTRKEMPQEMASAVNLMAHPLAGAAALSAIGFGVASQALLSRSPRLRIWL